MDISESETTPGQMSSFSSTIISDLLAQDWFHEMIKRDSKETKEKKETILSVLPEKEQIQKNNQLIIPSVQNICPIFGTELDYVSSNDNGLTSRFLQPENAFTILNRSKIPKESQIQDISSYYFNRTPLPSSRPVTQLLQGLQTSNLQHLIKHIEKKHEVQEETEETHDPKQTHNILNIPDVVKKHVINRLTLRDILNPDRLRLNWSDLNVHIETEQENESNLKTVLKVEQQVQTDFPKAQKKTKFRAKLGDVKVIIDSDGITHYYCPECSLEFPNKEDIEQHIQSHLLERKYQCKECGAMLKRKEHLDQHMRGHSDLRPYKCDICSRAFKRNEHLTRHSVIHSGTKDFSCNICTKAFSRKDHLRKHKQTHLTKQKNKQKEEGSYYQSEYINQKDSGMLFDKNMDTMTMPNQEMYLLKDNGLVKQETTLLQHLLLQNLEKTSGFSQTFTSMKEEVVHKDAENVLQAQAINVSDSLSQNTKYIPQF